MNRTVAYQETENDYDDVRQKIKGTQIATIKSFGVAPPSGAGDFVGQLGISADANGHALLYVCGVGNQWKLVGTSGDTSLPDTVVLEDMKNNFTEVDQRIEDCSIAYIENGTRAPTNVAIKGAGHIYIYETNPVEVYLSYDGNTWTPIHSASTGDVEADKPNNFTDPTQQILGSPIANIRKSSMTPDAAGIVPNREGEFYIQLAEGTVDKKARLWISNNSGGWKWESLSHVEDLPATVARTDKANDFQAWDQKISGKQILSFIDGVDKTPEQSLAVPDYEGQFYVATHTNIQGNKDVAIWVARGNAWLPIQQDIDLATVARTDKSNRFSQPSQILGEGGANARWLIGARIKFSGHAPNADQKWRVQNVGEITIYENNTTMPRQFSVWMGVSINPDPNSNLNEWAMVWSSQQGNLADYANLTKSNVFAPMQYITNGAQNYLINVGHEGASISPKGSRIPLAPGDTFTQSYSHPGLGETRNIWIAAIEGDTQSWKRLLSADDHDIILNNKPNYYENRDQFLGKDLDVKRNRIMGSRINHVGGPAYNGVAPTMFGEVVVCEEWDPTAPSDPTKKIVKAYLAVGLGRKSWLEIGSRLKTDLDLIDDGTNN